MSCLNIVLVNPLIPNNTGTIGRLCLATNSRLHLIKPLGFDISDARVKRAGLDYWQFVDPVVHESWEAFLLTIPSSNECFYFSSHGKQCYLQTSFTDGSYLIFGNEKTGLPASIVTHEKAIKITMDNTHVRSLNVSCAVSIIVYEARRQIQIKSI